VTLYIDASALVAMLAPEADGPDLYRIAFRDTAPLWSPVTRWETVVALSRLPTMDLDRAAARTDAFAAELGLRMVPIGLRENDLAMHAHATYGRARHPAALNMGDCFAYACAKANGARLLYKGSDFLHTDLA